MHFPTFPSSLVDILIAEDDGPLRSSLRFLLQKQGYVCVEAEDGRKALDLARHSQPRCVLLDLAMPEVDGLAVARQLRADPRTSGAHIHCITGRTDEAAREQAQRAGVETFFSKPISLSEILLVVEPQLGRLEEKVFTGLSLVEAEDILDWLEANGYPPGKLSFQPEAGFTVRSRARGKA